MVEEWRLEEAGPASDFFRVVTYYGASKSPNDNLTLRKVLAYEGIGEDTIHQILRRALDGGIPLASVNHEIVGATLAKCDQCAQILDDDRLSPAEKAEALTALVGSEDSDRLAADIGTFFRRGDPSAAEEEEEIETAGPISPVTM